MPDKDHPTHNGPSSLVHDDAGPPSPDPVPPSSGVAPFIMCSDLDAAEPASIIEAAATSVDEDRCCSRPSPGSSSLGEAVSEQIERAQSSLEPVSHESVQLSSLSSGGGRVSSPMVSASSEERDSTILGGETRDSARLDSALESRDDHDDSTDQEPPRSSSSPGKSRRNLHNKNSWSKKKTSSSGALANAGPGPTGGRGTADRKKPEGHQDQPGLAGEEDHHDGGHEQAEPPHSYYANYPDEHRRALFAAKGPAPLRQFDEGFRTGSGLDRWLCDKLVPEESAFLDSAKSSAAMDSLYWVVRIHVWYYKGHTRGEIQVEEVY